MPTASGTVAPTTDPMSMDLSPSWMLASLFVGTIGTGLFIYGKKQTRIPQLLVGMGLMVYPYFVSSPLWMIAIGVGILAGLWGAVRAGL